MIGQPEQKDQRGGRDATQTVDVRSEDHCRPSDSSLGKERYHKGKVDKVLGFGHKFIVSRSLELPPCVRICGRNGFGDTVAVERAIGDVKADLERFEGLKGKKQFQTWRLKEERKGA